MIQRAQKPTVHQASAGTPRKPRLTLRDRQLIAAIDRLILARDEFLTMAADAAEFQGEDPEWDARFEVRTREHDEAQRALWTLIKPGHFVPVVRGDFAYMAEPDGYVNIVRVSRLPDPE